MSENFHKSIPMFESKCIPSRSNELIFFQFNHFPTRFSYIFQHIPVSVALASLGYWFILIKIINYSIQIVSGAQTQAHTHTHSLKLEKSSCALHTHEKHRWHNHIKYLSSISPLDGLEFNAFRKSRWNPRRGKSETLNSHVIVLLIKMYLCSEWVWKISRMCIEMFRWIASFMFAVVVIVI